MIFGNIFEAPLSISVKSIIVVLPGMAQDQYADTLTPSPDGSEAALPVGSGGERFPRFLTGFIRWIVCVSALLVPVFFLPFTPDRTLAKVTLIEAGAVLAAAAWLLGVLLARRLSYRRTPLNAAFLVMAVALVTATALSATPWASFWGSDPTGEKTASLLSLAVFSFIAASVLRPADARVASGGLLVSFLALGLLVLSSMFGGRIGLAVPGWLDANPVGTPNALAVVLGAGFVFALGLTLGSVTSRGRRVLTRPFAVGAAVTAVVLAAALALIGFRMAWIGIAAIAALALAFNSTKVWPRGPKSADADAREEPRRPERALGGLAAGALFFILIATLFFTIRGVPFAGRVFPPSLEISPSAAATLAIGRRVLGDDPLFGAGPANFRSAFSRFRDPAINATAFWQVRFGHGFSFLTTAPATIGIVGTAALAALLIVSIIVIGRSLWITEPGDPYLLALGMAAVFVLLEWFLYAPNATASFVLFLALGLIGALSQEPRRSGARLSWWRATRRTILIDTPAMNFASSLVVIFTAAFSLVALWALGAAYAAEVYFGRAVEALNRFGNTDTAKVFLGRAAALDPKNDAYFLAQAQVAVLGVGRTIAQAASNPTPGLAEAFQSEFSGGVSAVQRAAALAESPEHWAVLGQLYELVIPFVAGADRAALEAYARAVLLDPPDPLLPLAKGRSLLAAADVISLQASQSQGGERERLDAAYKEALVRASSELETSIGLKSDFAQAHFLLAQIHLRQGNIAEAIRRVRETAALAPADIGVAFQLGFLHYRANELAPAEREFRRALTLNENYSNARYFLGLIYDRRGERSSALAEFEKVFDLNPENEEVRRILLNLRAGRRALEGIAPPGAAPEARREVPVPERGQPRGR